MPPVPAAGFIARLRESVVSAAREVGLLRGENGHVGARVSNHLVEGAKARSGIASTTALVEYALAKVALEDNFVAKLVARKGSVSSDLDLEL